MDHADIIRTRDVATTEGAIHRLSRAAASGILERLRRGAYVDRAAWDRATPAERLLLRMTALRDSVEDPVFSHASAALLLGMPILGDWPELPHLTVPRGSGKSSPCTRRTERTLPETLLVTRDGFRFTGALRTAIDLAAANTVLSGVIALSDARQRSGVRLEEFETEIERCRPFRGVRRVDRALELSSALSESPLESLLLVRCGDLGFALPEQQRVVLLDGGRTARVDFAWGDGEILLEADGRAKYLDADLRGGRSAEAVVVDEKLREDDLRERCRVFVRAGWADAWSGTALERKLVRAGVPRPGRRGPLTF